MNNTSPYLEGTDEIIPCGSACEALNFLQQIYHSAPISMLAISADFKVIRLNRRMADFAGKDSSSCPGLPVDQLFPMAASTMREVVTRVLQHREPLLNEEFGFSMQNQQVFWVINAYPITYDASHSLTVSLIIHDISALRNAQINLEIACQKIQSLQDKLKQENQALKAQIGDNLAGHEMIGSSKALKQVFFQVHKVAPTEATVLITGDTGTGKELVAREIHRCSRRAAQPLIVVNCAALPANLIESELFGHEKGSFTGAIARKIGRFEIASGGTIFLDEIGEMPLELQSKLLRVLQENQLERIGSTRQINIDVRVIAATNRNLKAQVAGGRFREDLFFRLNVFPIHLPALSEREGDVIEIATRFMQQFARMQGKTITSIAPESIARMQSYSWPGNIRELKNLIERAVILCQHDTLQVDLPETAIHTGDSYHQPASATRHNLNEVEKAHILQVLDSSRWRIRGAGGAAEVLGMKPTTLESKMARLGIKRSPNR